MISKYHFDHGANSCMQPRHKKAGAGVIAKHCRNRDLQWWRVDESGQFRDKANDGLYMARDEQKLVICYVIVFDHPFFRYLPTRSNVGKWNCYDYIICTNNKYMACKSL